MTRRLRLRRFLVANDTSLGVAEMEDRVEEMGVWNLDAKEGKRISVHRSGSRRSRSAGGVQLQELRQKEQWRQA
jgi:hypothetical protein